MYYFDRNRKTKEDIELHSLCRGLILIYISKINQLALPLTSLLINFMQNQEKKKRIKIDRKHLIKEIKQKLHTQFI